MREKIVTLFSLPQTNGFIDFHSTQTELAYPKFGWPKLFLDNFYHAHF